MGRARYDHRVQVVAIAGTCASYSPISVGASRWGGVLRIGCRWRATCVRDAVAHSCPRRRSRPTGRTTIRSCAARLQISPDCRAKLAATSLPPVHACALLPVTVVPANADRAAVAEAPRAMSALQPLLCKTCAKRAAVGRCGNCFAVGYCSVACMRSHRAAHEPFCRLLRSVTSRQASGVTTDDAWQRALFIGACETCGTYTTRLCGRCIVAFYCSPACQVRPPRPQPASPNQAPAAAPVVPRCVARARSSPRAAAG